MKRFRLSTRKCLNYAVSFIISSLALVFLFAIKWRDDLSSRATHPPQGVFRELLSDSERFLAYHHTPRTTTTQLGITKRHTSTLVTKKQDERHINNQHNIRSENSAQTISIPNDELRFNEIDINRVDEKQQRITEFNGWMVLPGNVTVHVGNISTPHNYTYIINSKDICKGFNNERLKLLIFVESNAGNVERRQAIRDTWGLFSLQYALNYRVVFMLGQGTSQLRVLKESYRYGDIIQENFPESFQNLALKSVMGLKWSINYCPEADYIMKTDDDLMIHVPNLLEILKGYPRDRKDLICHQNRVRKILRKELKRLMPTSYRKYMVRDIDLPGVYFPPYCSGMGYVFSAVVAHKLYEAAIVTPYFFIEDVYITGFCRQKAGLSLIDHPAITLKPTILSQQGGCAFKDGRVTSQEITRVQMREIWAEMNTQGYFCPQILGYVH